MLGARDRYAGLVLGNTKLWADRSLSARAFAGALSGRVGRHLIVERNAYVERMMPAAFKSRKLTPEVHAHYRGPFSTPESRVPVWVSPRELRTGRDFLDEVEAGLPDMASLPLLLLWAGKDPATRASERRRLEDTFPDHRTVELPGVGHYLWEEAPAETARAIRDWAGR
jgi:haloalkane dehalogenase